MSKSKAKGTAFESGVVRWLREFLEDDRIERRALHGSQDMGDVYGLYAHGYEGIAECKSYKGFSVSKSALMAEWFAETIDERENADADFALLIIHVPGRDATGKAASFGENLCYVQVRDLAKLCMMPEPTVGAGAWTALRLIDAARMMRGDR